MGEGFGSPLWSMGGRGEDFTPKNGKRPGVVRLERVDLSSPPEGVLRWVNLSRSKVHFEWIRLGFVDAGRKTP